MAEYNFTLTLAGDVDVRMDDLFEAGCDDATFSEVDGIPYAEFDREAESLAAAVLSAVRDVSSVRGIRVLHVDPDDLVTASEIAERLGRSRESVRLLIAGQRGPGGFPPPAARGATRNRMWRWVDVAAWADADVPAGLDVVAALNSALELRERRARLTKDERTVLAALTR